MLTVKDVLNEGREDVRVLEERPPFKVLEWNLTSPTSPEGAAQQFYIKGLDMHKHQLVCSLKNCQLRVKEGSVHWHGGEVNADMKEGSVEVYSGVGTLFISPTYQHIILEELAVWEGSLCAWKEYFLACDAGAHFSENGDDSKILTVSTIGHIALLSPVSRRELVTVELDDDTVVIDNSQAVCWSAGLALTMEAHGEGFRCTYRGTGRILMTNGV